MEFALGILVVGTACVLLAVIVIGPSRRVRAESKMPMETQVRLLLGLTDETGEVRAVTLGDDAPAPFDTAQVTALKDLDAAPAPQSEHPSEQSTGAA